MRAASRGVRPHVTDCGRGSVISGELLDDAGLDRGLGCTLSHGGPDTFEELIEIRILPGRPARIDAADLQSRAGQEPGQLVGPHRIDGSLLGHRLHYYRPLGAVEAAAVEN